MERNVIDNYDRCMYMFVLYQHNNRHRVPLAVKKKNGNLSKNTNENMHTIQLLDINQSKLCVCVLIRTIAVAVNCIQFGRQNHILLNSHWTRRLFLTGKFHFMHFFYNIGIRLKMFICQLGNHIEIVNRISMSYTKISK